MPKDARRRQSKDERRRTRSRQEHYQSYPIFENNTGITRDMWKENAVRVNCTPGSRPGVTVDEALHRRRVGCCGAILCTARSRVALSSSYSSEFAMWFVYIGYGSKRCLHPRSNSYWIVTQIASTHALWRGCSWFGLCLRSWRNFLIQHL